jgi:hypothetical protein
MEINEMDYPSFREQYELQHPASVPMIETDTNEYPTWLLPITLVMFIAASIVSGAHTVSTVRQSLESSLIPQASKDIVAYSAYFAFELALLVSVFSWIRRTNRWISYLATLVVFTVIVLANVQDVAHSTIAGAWFTVFVVIGLGVGTPLVALLSGKLFVDVYRTNKASGSKAKVEYQEALKQWDATINRAYTSYQKQNAQPSSLASNQGSRLSTQTGNRQTGSGYNRVSSAVEIAYSYLQDNPEASELSVRELGERAGVGKDSASKAKKQYLSNGHANHL